MTRPDNPFAASGVGALYARGRPYHHPRTLARAFALLDVERADRALDVACGTGMSTIALRELASCVVGADRSPEMLAAAPRRTGIGYVRAEAEAIPAAGAAFDGVTVCSGVHWFDQARFFAEVRRVLRPQGWVVLYDHYFLGDMEGVPEFADWTRDLFDRYPLPDRTAQVGDPRSVVPDGFEKVGDEFFADDIVMTRDELAEYLITISNMVAAVDRGASRDELHGWLRDSTDDFFAGAARTVRFLGSVTCLRHDGA